MRHPILLRHAIETRDKKIYTHRELQHFRGVYQAAMSQFLAGLDRNEPVLERVDKAHSSYCPYTSRDIEVMVMAYIPPNWLDLAQKTLGYKKDWDNLEGYYYGALYPIAEKGEKEFGKWWKAKYADFDIPKPPHQVGIKPVLKAKDVWEFGQLTIMFSGGGTKRDSMAVSAGDEVILRETVWMFRKEEETHLEGMKPFLLAVNRLCDWSQLPKFTKQQKRALNMRYMEIKSHFR